MFVKYLEFFLYSLFGKYFSADSLRITLLYSAHPECLCWSIQTTKDLAPCWKFMAWNGISLKFCEARHSYEESDTHPAIVSSFTHYCYCRICVKTCGKFVHDTFFVKDIVSWVNRKLYSRALTWSVWDTANIWMSSMVYFMADWRCVRGFVFPCAWRIDLGYAVYCD